MASLGTAMRASARSSSVGGSGRTMATAAFAAGNSAPAAAIAARAGLEPSYAISRRVLGESGTFTCS